MEAKTIEVVLCNKHPAYCLDLELEGALILTKNQLPQYMWLCYMCTLKWVTYNRGQNLLRNCKFCASTLKKTLPARPHAVVQREDNFIHWINHYPAEQMYSNSHGLW